MQTVVQQVAAKVVVIQPDLVRDSPQRVSFVQIYIHARVNRYVMLLCQHSSCHIEISERFLASGAIVDIVTSDTFGFTRLAGFCRVIKIFPSAANHFAFPKTILIDGLYPQIAMVAVVLVAVRRQRPSTD
jgi:hypothetical protein